jgi:hypothetical protein
VVGWRKLKKTYVGAPGMHRRSVLDAVLLDAVHIHCGEENKPSFVKIGAGMATNDSGARA